MGSEKLAFKYDLWSIDKDDCLMQVAFNTDLTVHVFTKIKEIKQLQCLSNGTVTLVVLIEIVLKNIRAQDKRGNWKNIFLFWHHKNICCGY